MATPIETNTEGLEAILQQVYDLPNRSAGGSSEPDLVLYANEDFWYADGPEQGTVDFDPAQVISVYQKVLAGEDVNVIISGRILFNSGYNNNDAAIFKASLVRVTESQNWLIILFPGFVYGFNSSAATMRIYETTFVVDVSRGTATIDNTLSRTVGSS